VTSREGVLHVPGPTALHHGGKLEDLQIGWTLSGPAGDGVSSVPVVLALGGISASRRVFDANGAGKGWWSEIVGPGKALDTSRLAVLGMDYIGSSEASSGPDGRTPFPCISSYDQADAALRLMDHLGIGRLGAIVGASYGGMVALAFGERYPQRVERLVVISAADVPHPMATAWRSVQRNIVRLGIAAKEPARGLELARALAMSTYRSAEEFAARFRAGPRLDSGRCFRWRSTFMRADAITRQRPCPNPSSAFPSPSTCTTSTRPGFRYARRWWPFARTSWCHWQTCAH
jgi:homoserine O-acetyltransferase